MKTFPCGCVNDVHPGGFSFSVSKCEEHRAIAGKGGLAHYEEMGCIVGGIPQHRSYCRRLEECLIELKAPIEETNCDGLALEIGCGLGMYAPLLMKLGYEYHAVEPDHEAAEFTRNTFMAKVMEMPFEVFPETQTYDIIVAAHVMEHVEHPRSLLGKAFRLLKTTGRLILIIPDDTDPVNPDHLSFWNQGNLHDAIRGAGFKNVRTLIRKEIERENFIYAVAEV